MGCAEERTFVRPTRRTPKRGGEEWDGAPSFHSPFDRRLHRSPNDVQGRSGTTGEAPIAATFHPTEDRQLCHDGGKDERHDAPPPHPHTALFQTGEEVLGGERDGGPWREDHLVASHPSREGLHAGSWEWTLWAFASRGRGGRKGKPKAHGSRGSSGQSPPPNRSAGISDVDGVPCHGSVPIGPSPAGLFRFLARVWAGEEE